MSISDTATGSDDRTTPAEQTEDHSPNHLELAARVERLEVTNRRLRSEHARLRQARHRTMAISLVAIATVAAAGGALFPGVRDILFALAATGGVGAVLTYFLTPGSVVAADVSERVYAALATNHQALVDSLGLRDERRYLPRDGDTRCQLFVPRYPDATAPDQPGPIVTQDDRRGVLLEPTGLRLYDAFEHGVTEAVASTPSKLTNQLADALVEQFELVNGASPRVGDGQVTVAISGSALGEVDRFDHPVTSLLGTGLAIGLERPIDVSVRADDGRAEWLVTCRWESSADS